MAQWCINTLQWCHNERNDVPNHQPQLFTHLLFSHRWEKTSKLRVTGLCMGNSPVTGEFPCKKGQWCRKCFHLMMLSWCVCELVFYHTPASRVRSVAPTVLVGSILYSYILSSNFRRCVACRVECKIKIFGNFLKFITSTLSCFDLGSDVNHQYG